MPSASGLPRRRNLFRCERDSSLAIWQPYSSVLPPPISPFSFPIREHRHPIFRDAPRARRSVSASQLSLHFHRKTATARYLISCAQRFKLLLLPLCFVLAQSRAASPATASIRRVPAAIASSFTIRNAPDLACRSHVRAAAKFHRITIQLVRRSADLHHANGVAVFLAEELLMSLRFFASAYGISVHETGAFSRLSHSPIFPRRAFAAESAPRSKNRTSICPARHNFLFAPRRDETSSCNAQCNKCVTV